ncbi:MAG: hypothetical protein E7290_05970 [Lachnospiraceae bacterium]|nr:hypothetical protein [Lachnospiraceae bacterium]
MVNTMSETSFEYNYSAKQQKEIEAIKKKYLPKEEDKLEILRRLDRSTERPGMIISLATGILGSLMLGFGMCWITKKQREKVADKILALSQELAS